MSTNITVSGVNETPGLVTQAANFLPVAWAKMANLAEKETDFFREFEGVTSRSPIWKNTDTTKTGGGSIIFRQIGGLHADGVIGDEITVPEQWRVNNFTLALDFFRHSTERTRRTDYLTGLKNELRDQVPVMLGNWLGNKKTTQIFQMFIHNGSAINTVYANGKPNREALRGSDTITMDGIVSVGQAMKTSGAMPAKVGTDGANVINRFVFVGLGEGLRVLKNSDAYRTSLQRAGDRGDKNYIFSGGYADVEGHIIRSYDPEDHPDYGPIGSALNPKALLGTAIAAGTTGSLDILGGGTVAAAAVAEAKYFENFSNFAYRFTPSSSVAADTTDRYVVIYNLANSASATDAGKWGFYRYATNNGNKLTTVNTDGDSAGAGSRLGSTTSGKRSTQIGNVTWSSSVNTDAHPLGSLIVETNSYGQAFGRALMMGAGCAVRGYGDLDGQRDEDLLQGGHFKQTYITSVFGQAPYQRADGLAVGWRIIEHAMSYAGLNLPQSTAA